MCQDSLYQKVFTFWETKKILFYIGRPVYQFLVVNFYQVRYNRFWEVRDKAFDITFQLYIEVHLPGFAGELAKAIE